MCRRVEGDARLEEVDVLGERPGLEPLEALDAVGAAEKDRAPGGREAKAARLPGRRVGVGGDHQAEARRPRPHEAVDDLGRRQESAAAVQEVEREGAVALGDRRVTGIRADVLLDEGGERGLGEVPVLVDPDVDEEVEIAGREAGAVEASARRRVGEVERAGGERHPSAARRGRGFNPGAHGSSPDRPSRRGSRRSRAPKRARAASPSRLA